MQGAEIVIIGGGVVGASVAYHLTGHGCRDVLILERESMLGLGSTGKATGGVRAQFGTEINVKLSLYSLDFFRDWEYDCGYEPHGYLFLATDEKQLEFLRRSGDMQRSLGYEEVKLVDTAAIAGMVPGLNCEDVVGGSFGPRDGFIDPLAVLEGFLSKASASGAQMGIATDVISIVVEKGRATGVETNRGKVNCEKVVICAGAWAKTLVKTTGIDLPVEPLRRQIVWSRAVESLPAEMPMVLDLSNGFHFRPARDYNPKPPATAGGSDLSGHDILFAYPDKNEQPGFSTDFDDAFINKIDQKVRHRAPFLTDAIPIREKCRAGLYENTPDHHAILGGCEVEGLYFANGFSGHGVMHSPATGRALAEIILDGSASFLDVSCLSLDRFAQGELLHETASI